MRHTISVCDHATAIELKRSDSRVARRWWILVFQEILHVYKCNGNSLCKNQFALAMIALHHFNANICAKFRLYLCVIALAAITHANEVVILYTADVHGCVFNSGLCGEARDSGGLLRCAALIEDVRKRNPDVVLLDLGDLFQGTAESYLTRGLLVAEIVKSMRYDGLVVGNHEFDWGIETLWKFYERAETQVLAADIFTAFGGNRIEQSAHATLV